MKKIIILILIVLFAFLFYSILFGNITVFGWTNSNINDIKEADANLDKKINTAKELNMQKYPQSISSLETSIDDLKKVKEKYENKVKYLEDDLELGVVQIKEYKIDRLWVALGNYAKDEKVTLKLDIVETGKQGVYDLNITLVGEYIGITDFIYDIEKDDTLGFKIMNFKIAPNTSDASDSSSTGTNSAQSSQGSSDSSNTHTTYINVSGLKATFKIESVGIEFD